MPDELESSDSLSGKVKQKRRRNLRRLFLFSPAISVRRRHRFGFAFDVHFLQNPARAAEFVGDKKNVANINGNRSP